MNKKCLFLLIFASTMSLCAGENLFIGKKEENQKREFRYIDESEVPFFIEDEIFRTINVQVNFVINPTKGQQERRDQIKEQYKAPTGLSFLLYGSPGTGKTEMAKYIAYKNGYLFTMIKQDDFASPLANQSELNLARIMKHIKKVSQEQPVVVLFDEIDSYIFSREGWALQQHNVDLVNAFLQHLEMLNQNHNVIIFGTTNRYQSLDKAAVRPGRFNYHYQINYPSKQLISAYLDKKLPVQIFVNHDGKKRMIERIIKESNFSYAYLGLLVNQILESYIKTGKVIANDQFFSEKPQFSLINRMKEFKETLLHNFNDTSFRQKVIEGGVMGLIGLSGVVLLKTIFDQ